jgi:hypothetical protein
MQLQCGMDDPVDTLDAMLRSEHAMHVAPILA